MLRITRDIFRRWIIQEHYVIIFFFLRNYKIFWYRGSWILRSILFPINFWKNRFIIILSTISVNWTNKSIIFFFRISFLSMIYSWSRRDKEIIVPSNGFVSLWNALIRHSPSYYYWKKGCTIDDNDVNDFIVSFIDAFIFSYKDLIV
jgi:hypothetical protein